MTNSKALVLCVIALSACVGCSMKIHKDYAFTEPEFTFNTGVIHAKLRGTMENIDDNTSVNHSPYEMLLWFTSSNEMNPVGCLVSLESMTLKNVESGENVLIPETSEIAFRERSDGGYMASFNYKNLNLLYADHELEFKYSFSRDCGFDQASVSVNMLFQKQYSERNISFWDTLMGV
jgi:hypothetical protein